MRATVDVLRQVPYFAELETRPLRDLAALVRERKYRTREAILLEGEPCEGLNVLLSGGREGDGEVARIPGQECPPPGSRMTVLGRACWLASARLP